MATDTHALDTQPIGKLLMKYSLPAIAGMVATSLYNFIDSIFIGSSVGTEGIAALSVCLPVMNIVTATAYLSGWGGSSEISINLGKKDFVTANKALCQSVSLTFIMSIVFGVMIYAMLNPLLTIFGASGNVLALARQYMVVILLGSPITNIYTSMSFLARSAGHPNASMCGTLASVGINLALAPLLIFVFNMGMTGAAIATVSAQVCIFFYYLHTLNRHNDAVSLAKGSIRPDFTIFLRIIKIGIAPYLMTLCLCLIFIVFFNSLHRYGGNDAIAAYGIISRFSFIFVMIVQGLSQGMQPLTGYYFGAKEYDKMKRCFWLTASYSAGIMTVCLIISEFFPAAMVSMFTSDATLTSMCIYGMRIGMSSSIIMSIPIICPSFFVSTGQVKKSIFLSLVRQLIILMPLMLILSATLGLDGIWISLPLSDLLSFILCIFMLRSFFKQYN